MDLISSILTDIWHICNSMSPYILLGFLLAGLLHEFVPADFFIRHLSGKNFRSVLLSALFGIPLPLCSCGVIPTAMGLRREGISKGATVSFLIATPQINIRGIIALFGKCKKVVLCSLQLGLKLKEICICLEVRISFCDSEKIFESS